MAVSPHEPQEPPPLEQGQSHLEAGELQGRREFGKPMVWHMVDVLSLGIQAGLDVANELCWGGPVVLGKRHGD